jgi:DNA-binding transcriptional LysR family regulator
MEFRQLEYVVAAAEEANFTRAAARVHVAQPAISQQIAQLERELGEKLFDRSERRIRLTPAGEAFLPYARTALAATAAARDAVTSLRGELAGRLTIGTIPSPPGWLVERLGRYRGRHPKVRLTLRAGDPEVLTAAVAAGTLDAAIIGVSAERLPAGPGGQRLRSGLASQTVATEPLVVAVAPGHRLAGAADASLWELRHEPFLTLTPGTGLRTALENACADAGFTPGIDAETDDLAVLADLAAHGLGVAVLPRSAAGRASRDLVVVPLREPAPHRPMALVWHRHRVSAPGRAFLDLAEVRDEAGVPAPAGGDA